MYLPSNWTEVFKDPLARSIPLWGFFFGGFALLFSVPADVLDVNPVLAIFVRAMSSAVPSITGWGQHSAFPQPTLLYFSYAWASIPLQAFIVFLNRSSESTFLSAWTENPGRAPLRALALLIALASFVGITAFVSFGDSASCSACIGDSKIALAILGGFVAFSNAGLIATFGWWVKNFKLLHFS